jgi:NAD(P)-dependent dehydrogenase (short-subunit alcohol dehydrogenase family)
LGASAPGNCGWEIAKQLAEQGARVTVAARRMEGLRALAGLIGGLAVYCDTSVEEDLETLAEATAAEHGPIDIAISAAGVPFVGTIDAIAPDLMRQAFDINFFGPYHFVKHMTRRIRGRLNGRDHFELSVDGAPGLQQLRLREGRGQCSLQVRRS